MTKVKPLFLLLFLLTNLPLSAQLKNSLFWEARANPESKPIYIFGTHHMYDFQFIHQNPIILDKLKAADVMYGEITIKEGDPALVMKVMNAMMMKEKTLKSLMSDKDYQATGKYLKEMIGMDIAFFNKLKPIAIQQTIMLAKYSKMTNKKNLDDMNSISNSMDLFLQKKAKEYKKDVLGLETVEDQLNALYGGYSLQRQTEMLLEVVYGKDEDIEELENMNQYYQSQDLEKLYKYTKKNMKENEMKSLLTDRNEKWIPVIESKINEGKSLFIAVGAGHLPGKLGVLNLLKDKGYQIKPIQIQVK